MSVIAIIPARGGSKRIPGKNVRSFFGKPVIAYSIAAAKDAKVFDHIIVSTDSIQIAEVALQYHAEIPFIRPEELSDDETATEPVLIHAISWLREHGIEVDYFCCIYATAPFVRPEYILRGFDILKRHRAITAFSVTTYPYTAYKALRVDADGRLKVIWPEYLHTGSNRLPTTYHDAGQFYWADTEKFLIEKTLFSSDSLPVVLPRNLVQDIDTPEDWDIAEQMYRVLQMKAVP